MTDAVRKEIATLRDEIRRHNSLYYVEAAPEVTDQEFDRLMKRLEALEVDTLILTGVCTDICVQHTAAEGFFRGFKVVIPKDGTAALTPEDHEKGLRYMARTYGAKMTTLARLIQRASNKERHSG